MRAQVSNHDFELLSAYVDGQLSSGEKTRLEEQLKTRPELKQAYEDLRQMRALLRAAPRRRSPRSFALTPAMLEPARPRRSGLFQSLFPGLSFASALSAVVLVATLLLNLSPMSPSSIQVPEAAQDTASLAAEESFESIEAQPEVGALAVEEPAEGELFGAAPPTIHWADPTVPQMQKDLGIYAQAPQSAMGRGGGDGNTYGMGGGGGYSMPFSIPLEAVESLEQESEASTAPVLPESAPEFAGGGPILGVPSAEQQGQVIISSAWGAPLNASDQPTSSEATVAAGASPVEDQTQPLLGLPSIRWIQIVLGILALGTGLAAFVIFRSSRAR